MARSSQYKHYMQRIDIPGQNIYDIENESGWRGLRYEKAVGLYDIGKSKNIYTEGYADSDRLRVYMPPDGNYANEATVVTMTFIVIGDPATRQQTIANFTEYVRKGIHTYVDDARYAKFDFIVTDEIKVSDERWHGSQPYVELEIRMQNLNGKTQNVTPEMLQGKLF